LWLRNHLVFGDWTGTAAKVQFLGWSRRPLTAWSAHPIFSVSGMWTFWSALMNTFWRGEFIWHLRPIANPHVDAFYGNTSIVLLVAAIAGWKHGAGTDRVVHASIWATVIVSILGLAALSVQFDYGYSRAPSRDFPYFVASRHIGAAFVPFLVLYVDGIACLLKGSTRVVGPLAFVAFACVLMLASELVLSAPMFADPFNWFHLP